MIAAIHNALFIFSCDKRGKLPWKPRELRKLQWKRLAAKKKEWSNNEQKASGGKTGAGKRELMQTLAFFLLITKCAKQENDCHISDDNMICATLHNTFVECGQYLEGDNANLQSSQRPCPYS